MKWYELNDGGMARHIVAKTTFEPDKVIQPIYTGGPVALSKDGRLLVTSLGADALLTDLSNGDRLARIEGVSYNADFKIPQPQHANEGHRMENNSFNLSTDLSRKLKPHTSPVVSSTTDYTGTLLATGASDGVVKIWDIRGGYTTHTFHGHGGIISALHFFETRVVTSEAEAGSKKQRRNSDLTNGASTEDTSSHGQRNLRLASGSEDGKIRIWNLETSKSMKILDSHVSVVRSLQYDLATNTLLSASRDKTVMLWDSQSWKLKHTIPVFEGIESSGFLNSGLLFYTGGEGGRIRIWNVKHLKEITREQIPRGEGQSIINVLYHEHLPFMLSVHADQTLQLHSTMALGEAVSNRDLPPLSVLRRISGTHDEVIDIAYCGRDSSLLAIATNIEDVRIISLGNSKKDSDLKSNSEFGDSYFGSDVASLQGHEDIIICMDVDWSGNWLATGAKDNTARLWRVDPEQDLFECFAIFTGHTESIGAIAVPKTAPPSDSNAHSNPLHQPPRFLLTGSQDKTIKRWDSTNIQPDTKRAARATYTRKAHDKDINAIDLNHDSTLFASASQDRTVKIWSTEDGEAAGILRGHRRGVWSVQFAPRDISPISGEAGSQTSAPKGLVLTGSGDKTLKIWSLADYSCLRTFEGHTNSVLKVVWLNPSRDDNHAKSGTHVVSAGGDGLVKVWDANSGEVECTLDNHEDRVWALTIDKRSNEIVSGGGDSTITFWKDTTSNTVAAAAAASTARVEQDQQLQNYIHAGSYRQAITLALQLNHPARLLSLFTTIVSKHPPDKGSLCGEHTVDEALGSLSDEQLVLLLLRLRDWNTNMKTAPVAQRILWTLLKSYPASRFTRLKLNASKDIQGASLKEVLDVLKAYTERQYRRIEELMDESHLLEYTLREMDQSGVGGGRVNGVGANGMHEDRAVPG